MVVSLKKILDGFDFASDEVRVYLDPATGEVLTVCDDELESDEGSEPPDLDSLLPLPDKFDIHEWQIMKRFAQSLPDHQSDVLLDAIHGPGAFRSFRRDLDRLDLRDAWFAFRHAALKAIAVDWLEENGLAFADDAD